MSAQEYRPRIVIKAMQWDGSPAGTAEIVDWVYSEGGECQFYAPGEFDNETDGTYICLDTPNSARIACPGYWVIKGVTGNFFACRAEKFAEDYELVES